MTVATRRVLRALAVAGQCLLVSLCTAWAFFERPAPVVNVRWREGLQTRPAAGPSATSTSSSARTTLKATTSSDRRVRRTSQPSWRTPMCGIPLVSIGQHATLTGDSYRGTLRVWWVGPFKGARGRVQFRVLLGVIGLITLLCAWITNPNPRTFFRRVVLGPWP